jgi:D-alanine-D-alanine ligase-like ATP-grasp enzyme
MKIFAIFCGGYSSEHNISIKSSATIKDNFPKDFEVVRVIVGKGTWKVELDNNNLVDLDIRDMTYIDNNIKYVEKTKTSNIFYNILISSIVKVYIFISINKEIIYS